MKQGLKSKIAILMLAISIPASGLLQDVNAATSSAANLTAKRDKLVKTAISLQNKVDYVHWTKRQEKKAPYKTDCSGFTYLVYKLANVGVGLVNRDDDAQAKVGTSVAWGKFQKGDLIFTWNSGSKNKKDVGHVGIYIGNGKMIHNASSKSDVIITDIYKSSYYKDRFIVAKRVIK